MNCIKELMYIATSVKLSIVCIFAAHGEQTSSYLLKLYPGINPEFQHHQQYCMDGEPVKQTQFN